MDNDKDAGRVAIESTQLLACPFCGKHVCKPWMDEHDTDGSWVVTCDIHKGGCGSSTGYLYATAADAVAAWNLRQPNA